MIRKSFAVALLAFVGTLVSWGQCLVTAPNNPETLLLGSQYMIKWNTGGYAGTVRIVLRRNDVKIGDIAAGVPNSGVFAWKVGDILNGKAPVGGGYKIRVRSQDNTCGDDSDHPFSIETIFPGGVKLEKKPGLPPLAGKINVVGPAEGSRHLSGAPLPIHWTPAAPLCGPLTIYLMDKPDGQIREVIQANVPNTGAFLSWIAPMKYSWPGSRHVVKIASPNNACYGYSGSFTIENPPPPQPKKEKFIVRNAVIANSWGSDRQDNGKSSCLSAPVVQPGRPANAGEVKIGHYVTNGKHGDCYWIQGYYFRGKVWFDLDAVKGREIVGAVIQLSMSGSAEEGPQGTLATNEELFSKCDIYILNGPWPSTQPAANFYPGSYYKSFTLFSTGAKTEVDITDAVRAWASGQTNFGFMFRGPLNRSKFDHSICLKYYTALSVTVKYME